MNAWSVVSLTSCCYICQ